MDKFVDGILVTDTAEGEPMVTWPLLEYGVETCLHISEVANCPDLAPGACASAVVQMTLFLGCICDAWNRALVEMPERWASHAEQE